MEVSGMKKFILVLIALFCSINSAYAMAPIDEPNVKAAAAFGVSKKEATTNQLLAGWTAKDRKQTNKFGENERAIVFTPYLAVAVNAQTEAARGKTTTLADDMELAKKYDGVLAVSLILDSSFKVEPKYLRIRMYQGNNVAEPYYTSLEAAVTRNMTMSEAQLESKAKLSGGLSATEQEKLNAVKKDVENRSKATVKTGKTQVQKPVVSNVPTKTVTVQVWNLQYFTYFDLSKLDITKRMVLNVSDQAGGDREFVLEIPNLK
jgi:hypothetical protein